MGGALSSFSCSLADSRSARVERAVQVANEIMNTYSSVTHDDQKAETAQASIGGRRVNKIGSVHTVEYYSAIRKEALTHAATWVHLEDLMLIERSQTQKDS